MRDPSEGKPLRKKAEKIPSERHKSVRKAPSGDREFQAIFELSSVGMTERDAATGLRIRVNHKLCEMTGYSAEELLKEKGVKLTHPDDRERNRGARAAVLKGESDTWFIEKRYVRKNGEVIWVHVNGNLIRDSSGQPYRTVAVIQDITERKRAETELGEDRECLWRQFKEIESIYNSAPIGLCLFDEQMRYVRINDRLAEMNGIPAADHIGRSVRDILPGFADKAEELGRRVFATGQPVMNIEFSGETAAKPGVLRSRIEHWLPLKDQAGRVASLNVVVEEVTERKRAEEILRQSQIDLDRAQGVGQIGSWRMDVHRNVLTWSDETYRIFGVPKGTPMSYEAFLEIVHPDDRQYVETKWQAALRSEPYDIEHRIAVGRKVKWVREKAYLEFDDEGKPLGGFGIAQDITDRKRIEEELRESEIFLKETQTIARVGGWKANPDTDFLQWTEGVYHIIEAPLDYKPGVAEGLKFYLPKYIPILRDKLQHSLKTGEPFHLECEAVTTTGKRLWTEVRGLAQRIEGKTSYVIGTFQDITERKHAEEMLRQRTLELETLTGMLEKRIQERTKELTKSYERLQQLASQLLLAQEKERKRVAVELHDGLLSELAAMKMLFEAKVKLLEQGNLSDLSEFKGVSDILARVIKESRRMMNNLQPSVLDELGLLAAIN